MARNDGLVHDDDSTKTPQQKADDLEAFLTFDGDREPETQEPAKEPEVKIEEPAKEPAVVTDVQEAPTPPPSADLTKALSTIERLESEVRNLRETRVQQVETPLETVEFFPGLRIAKDETKRPIQLTDKNLIDAGWNENPAKAINALANSFYAYILQTIPQIAVQAIERQTQGMRTGENRKSAFFEAFPDLKGHDDLLEIVERRAREDGLHERFRGVEYARELGKEARKRVAQIRGMTIEQYTASLSASSEKQPAARTASRATTSTQSARSGASQSSTMQKELDDLN